MRMIQRKKTAALPVGRRVGLSNPKAPGTAAPLSKINGNPIAHVTRTDTPAGPVSPQRTTSPKPAPVLEHIMVTLPLFKGASPTQRLQARAVAVNVLRQAIVKTAPRVSLNTGKPNGWDWIKGPKGFNSVNAIAKTREPAIRGVQQLQQQVPAKTLDKLAQESERAERLGPVGRRPVSTLEDTTPVELGVLQTEIRKAVPRADVKEEAGEGFGRLAFLVGAVFVAWLVLKQGAA